MLSFLLVWEVTTFEVGRGKLDLLDLVRGKVPHDVLRQLGTLPNQITLHLGPLVQDRGGLLLRHQTTSYL